VVQQTLPVLTYDCELYPEPSEQQRRLAAEIQRWVVGAYRGSNVTKVEGLAGISDLHIMMQNKQIRWAASVYGRHLPELREKAEQILQTILEEDAELRPLSGEGQTGMEVKIEELDAGVVEE